MLRYFDSFLQKSWFSKTNNCSFCNKTTQDFAEFWEIWVNFKAKTKTEDEGILRKGKRSSSWFFSLHIGLAGREENQIFCYAKHASEAPKCTLENRACLPVCTICLESVRAMVYIFVHRGHLFWLPESAMKTKNSHSPAASPASQLSLLFLSCILVPFFKGKNRWKMRWWISIMQWADIATIFHVL